MRACGCVCCRVASCLRARPSNRILPLRRGRDDGGEEKKIRMMDGKGVYEDDGDGGSRGAVLAAGQCHDDYNDDIRVDQ